jgi:hypothetical protein
VSFPIVNNVPYTGIYMHNYVHTNKLSKCIILVQRISSTHDFELNKNQNELLSNELKGEYTQIYIVTMFVFKINSNLFGMFTILIETLPVCPTINDTSLLL